MRQATVALGEFLQKFDELGEAGSLLLFVRPTEQQNVLLKKQKQGLPIKIFYVLLYGFLDPDIVP